MKWEQKVSYNIIKNWEKMTVIRRWYGCLHETPKYCLPIYSNNEFSNKLFTKTTAYKGYIKHKCLYSCMYTPTYCLYGVYVILYVLCVYRYIHAYVHTHFEGQGQQILLSFGRDYIPCVWRSYICNLRDLESSLPLSIKLLPWSLDALWQRHSLVTAQPLLSWLRGPHPYSHLPSSG